MNLVSGTDWLAAQFWTWLAALCGGGLLALLWQVYGGLLRRVRRADRARSPRAWLLPDALFALFAAAALLFYWFLTTDGGLRSNDLLWMALGFCLARPLFRRAARERRKTQPQPGPQRPQPSRPQPQPSHPRPQPSRPRPQPSRPQPPPPARPDALLRTAAGVWRRLARIRPEEQQKTEA